MLSLPLRRKTLEEKRLKGRGQRGGGGDSRVALEREFRIIVNLCGENRIITDIIFDFVRVLHLHVCRLTVATPVVIQVTRQIDNFSKKHGSLAKV